MVVDAGVGSGVEAAGRVAAVDPDLWVVALGTNDVANLDGVEAYATAIDTLLGAVPDDAPLVWIDVYVDTAEEASATFNRVLRDRLGQRGGATVVDWASVADDDGVLYDGVHPGEDGNLVFADRAADGVAAWLG
jgi:lysophospholipase L1-like esterase